MRKLVLLLTLLLWATPVMAQDTQTVVTDDQTYNILSRDIYQQKISNAQMTIMGLTLGKHTLKDVQSELGKAELLPGLEHKPNRVCYISGDNSDGTILIFQAWEISSVLTSFRILSSQANFKESDQCAKSKLISKDMVTDGGLRLGLSRQQLKAILGKPTKEQGNSLLYVYHSKQSMTKEEIDEMKKVFRTSIPPSTKEEFYWDITSSIEGIFLNKELIVITVTKLETY